MERQYGETVRRRHGETLSREHRRMEREYGDSKERESTEREINKRERECGGDERVWRGRRSIDVNPSHNNSPQSTRVTAI